ncbi:MAG TPA: sulfatase [Actinomycetota bacterium]|jgi:arylsulfatase A-like enzyme|nr:sulfatase [Actinomycetota bacterium]
MPRSPFLRICALALALSFPVSVGAESTSLQQMSPDVGEPPNIVVILTDDQREAGTMQALPAVRRIFGRGGTRYTQAYATTPNCCPSRSSIFTGRYAHNHKVKRNIIGDAPQLNQQSTVQRYLRDLGYRSGIYGKYLNNWEPAENPPHFDDWAVFSRPNRYYDVNFNVNGVVRNIKGYSNRFIANRSLRFLRDSEADDSRPWLLYLAPYAPHMPAVAEPAYRSTRIRAMPTSPSRQEYDRGDKPFHIQVRRASVGRAAGIRKRQLRSLRSVDDMVRDVFAELDGLGEVNTLAFFLSDNGYLWAEHGVIGKTMPYIESVKVPFFVRWPGRVPAGAQDSRLVANIDLAPTILDAAGTQPDPELPMDGRSLFAGAQRDRLLLEYWPEASGRPPMWASILTPTYQYVEYYAYDETSLLASEYYDLSVDPWQLTNFLGDQDSSNDPVVTELSERLSRDRTCSGVHCP